MVITLDDNISEPLFRAQLAALDLTSAMKEIAGQNVTAIKRNFRNQSSPLGVPWAKSQRARDEVGLTLVLSGDLFGSIKAAWNSVTADAGPEDSGGAAIYAAIHQWGGPIKRKIARALRGREIGPPKQGRVTMPARPYVGWNEAMKKQAGDVLARHVQAAFTGSSGPAT